MEPTSPPVRCQICSTKCAVNLMSLVNISRGDRLEKARYLNCHYVPLLSRRKVRDQNAIRICKACEGRVGGGALAQKHELIVQPKLSSELSEDFTWVVITASNYMTPRRQRMRNFLSMYLPLLGDACCTIRDALSACVKWKRVLREKGIVKFTVCETELRAIKKVSIIGSAYHLEQLPAALEALLGEGIEAGHVAETISVIDEYVAGCGKTERVSNQADHEHVRMVRLVTRLNGPAIGNVEKMVLSCRELLRDCLSTFHAAYKAAHAMEVSLRYYAIMDPRDRCSKNCTLKIGASLISSLNKTAAIREKLLHNNAEMQLLLESLVKLYSLPEGWTRPIAKSEEEEILDPQPAATEREFTSNAVQSKPTHPPSSEQAIAIAMRNIASAFFPSSALAGSTKRSTTAPSMVLRSESQEQKCPPRKKPRIDTEECT